MPWTYAGGWIYFNNTTGAGTDPVWITLRPAEQWTSAATAYTTDWTAVSPQSELERAIIVRWRQPFMQGEPSPQARALQHEHERANERAEALLTEHLSEAQRDELRARGFFTVEITAPSGERKRYRVHRGQVGNIVQVSEAGQPLRRLCVHPDIHVPDADAMLAQMLWLQHSEPELVSLANITEIPNTAR